MKNVIHNQLTDNIIIDFNRGQHKAFETIFLTYFPRVKYYINGFVKSIDVAEELTQNVFLKIWESRESIVIPAKGFDSYLFTIAYRQTVDYIRRKKVQESFYNDQINMHLEKTCIEEEYIAEETRLLIEVEIENMPERQKRIYKLSRNEGIPNNEIAEQLNVSKRTVENQLSLATKRLKDKLSLYV